MMCKKVLFNDFESMLIQCYSFSWLFLNKMQQAFYKKLHPHHLKLINARHIFGVFMEKLVIFLLLNLVIKAVWHLSKWGMIKGHMLNL